MIWVVSYEHGGDAFEINGDGAWTMDHEYGYNGEPHVEELAAVVVEPMWTIYDELPCLDSSYRVNG